VTDAPPTVAVMSAVPTLTAVTRPALTVATFALLDVHVTVSPVIGSPS
jgi:hypothetical protein